jgi:hypothetical protein
MTRLLDKFKALNRPIPEHELINITLVRAKLLPCCV